jgi:hypothetical protein
MHVFQMDIEQHWRLEFRKVEYRYDSFQNNRLILQLRSSYHLAQTKTRGKWHELDKI